MSKMYLQWFYMCYTILKIILVLKYHKSINGLQKCTDNII